MKNKLYAFIAAFLGLAVITGSAFGFAPVEVNHFISVDVAWIEGFTAHLDTIGGMATVAAAGVKEQIETAVKELRETFDQATKGTQDKLRENFETILKEWEPQIKAANEAGKGSAELKEQVAKASTDNAKLVDDLQAQVKKYADDLNARIEKIESKRVMTPQHPNFGKELAEAMKKAEFVGTQPNRRARYEFEKWGFKDITISDSAVYVQGRVPGIIPPGVRQLRVRDLLPVNRTSMNTVYFVSETAVTDNASPQSALGAKKGETTFTIDVENEAVRTVAHFTQIPTQVLDDIPALEDYINSRMLFLLEQEEEDQLLYGNDQGQNLNGLMTQATAFDTTLDDEIGVTATSDIDRIRVAMAQVQVAHYPPSGIVMHPYNWASIELTKDGEQRYIWARPQDAGVPRLWGLPVVATTAMASPDFLVGAFQLGAAIWDRQQASIQISTEDSDNFQKNLATIRAEERITLTVYRPASFVEGDFANTVT